VSTPNRNDGAEWVTLRTAAQLTGKSVKTMRRWATERRVLAQKDDKGYWFLSRQDVLEAEPVAEAKAEGKAELVVLTETMEKMQASFHSLAEDLAAASERAGRAEGERDALTDEGERLRASAEQRAEFEKARRQRADAEVERLKAELDRRWWHRRRTR